MSFLRAENGVFFERRGRKGFAEVAKEAKEKNTKLRKEKIKEIKNLSINCLNLNAFRKAFFFEFPFLLSFLRPLRILCALCVQKIPAFPQQATKPEGAHQ
jgi:hypothetical protein